MINFLLDTFSEQFDIETIYCNIGIYVLFKNEEPDNIEIDLNILKETYIINYEIRQMRQINQMNQMIDVKLIVPQDKLEQLPILTYSESNKINTNCCCCFEEFKEDSRVRKVLCGHLFCPPCIDEWLTSHSYKCPLCRAPAGEYIQELD